MHYLAQATNVTVVAGTGVNGAALNQLSNSIRYLYVTANQSIFINDVANSRATEWVDGGSTGVLRAGSGTAGNALTQVNYPYSIWVDSASNVFVSEYSNHRVTKWIPGSSTAIIVAGTGTAGTFICSGENYIFPILRFSVLLSFSSLGSTTSQLSSPTGLYYDEANQELYIANYGSSATVMKWAVGASNGTIVAGVLGSPGSSATQLNGPTGIVLDQWQNLYVNDRTNNRIQFFCKDSMTGVTIAGNGTGGSILNNPYDVKIDSHQHLYVAENGANRVVKFTKL